MYDSIKDVKSVYTTDTDITFLHFDNSVTFIHRTSVALYQSAEVAYTLYKVPINDTVEVYSNRHAFVGVDVNGVAYAWGQSPFADSGGIIPPTMGPVRAIYTTGNAFVGHQTSGVLRAWGDSTQGGCENTQYDNNLYTCMPVGLSDVTIVYANAVAFAALKYDKTIVAWGMKGRGGDPGNITGVGAVYSTRYAFAALREDGTVQCWGDKEGGGNNTTPSTLSNVVAIFANEHAFVALRSDKTVAAWGNKDYGGDPYPASSQSPYIPPTLKNVETVFSSYIDWAAMHTDGSVTVWGRAGLRVQGTIYRDVSWVYADYYNLYILHNSGKVEPWGANMYAPLDPTMYSNIAAVYGTDIMNAVSINPNHYDCPMKYGISREVQCISRSTNGGGGGGGGGSTSSSDEETDESGFAIGCAVVFVLGLGAVGAMYVYKKREAAAARAATQGQGVGTTTQNPIAPPPPPGPAVSRQTAVFDTDSIYMDDTEGEFSGSVDMTPQYNL